MTSDTIQTTNGSDLPPGAGGPLSGRRVIELGSTVAGPFCGRLLADFGAEVIKVEPPEGDAVRSMGKRAGKSLYAASILRNKKLVCLDLRRPEAQDIVRRLAASADILVENFRPGTMERWGLSYDRLRAVNRGLIMVRISGYGQDGPYRDRPGYGVIGEAVGGLRELTGDPDRPPARVAVSLTDQLAALYAAYGAVLALHDRERTGEGQVIDAALYESAFSFMEPHVPAYAKLKHVATRAGSRLPDHTPNNLYRTSDGRFLHVTAASPSMFGRLCEVMGRPELARDPRFASGEARAANQDALDSMIAEWFSGKDLAEAEEILLRFAIPAGRIYTMADIFADPHYRARQMLVDLPDEEIGPITVAGVVPKMSATPGVLRWAGRKIGEDTADVLAQLAGLDGAEIQRLEEAGVIRCAASSEAAPTTTG